MSIIEALVLGVVQGLTEFIPISSTAHLEIVPVLLGWGDPGAAASAVIQFGTWIAAVLYFFRDIVRLVAGFFRGLMNRRPLTDVDSREAWLVVIGTIPIVVLGLVLKKHIESTSTWRRSDGRRSSCRSWSRSWLAMRRSGSCCGI